VKLQRHILGLELLDSPYKLIAADINNDRRINGQDLVELRKLILGIYTELPQNDSWVIMKAGQTMDMNNPWSYDESITISEMASDMMDVDFIGVKVGDLDNSVIANATQNTVTNSRGTSFSFDDTLVGVGEQVEVTMTSAEALYGYQFTLDMTKMDLVTVTGVEESNVAVFDAALTMSMASTEAVTGELFTLTLTATQAGKVSELLGMNSSITKAEAYVGKNLEQVDLQLAGAQDAGYSLGQNEPNPFKEQTRISYTLPEAAKVQMTLYDVTGKVLEVIRAEGAKGENVLTVSNEKLTTGVVYYKLETGEYTATKHMIVIE
jgi:hypothetical protein